MILCITILISQLILTVEAQAINYKEKDTTATRLSIEFRRLYIDGDETKLYNKAEELFDYIKKQGKFANTGKAETSVEGSYREFGTVPSSISIGLTDMDEVVALLENGYSVTEIIKAFPKYAFKVNSIEAVKQAFLAEKYRETMRHVEVIYKFGATGTGKTRSIYKDYAPEEVCRITSYGKNGVKFDSYKSEDVLVFEEYAGQIPIEEFMPNGTVKRFELNPIVNLEGEVTDDG